MRLTLKQLQVFRAVVRHGNLGSAAEALFLSKPAMSMALQELEKHLGHKLFDRVNQRLQLNAQGQRLVPLADELLQRAEDIELSFRNDTALGGVLHIGASKTIGNYLLPELLGDFLAQYPACDPQVTIANSRVLAGKMANYELDVCLIEGELHDPRVIREDWLADDMALLVAPAHPLAEQARRSGVLQFSDLDGAQWLLRESGSGTREHFDVHIAPHLARWPVRLELTQSEALLGACRAGLGVAYLSELAARRDLQDGLLYRLPLATDTRRQLRMVWQEGKYLSPLLAHFMAFCREWRGAASAQEA